jgi:uncharacterized membrane protein (DUF4010 family)
VDTTLVRFVIAFLIGTLIGLEREKVNRDDGEHRSAGLRTFIMIAQAGAIAAWLSTVADEPWIFIGAGAICAWFIMAGYRAQLQTAPRSIGLTTEFAELVTYLLGGVTLFGYPELAVALAIATSAILAYREKLHEWVAKTDWDDIFAGLKLLIVAFIVLPVVPREPVDPWGAINPYDMTWLVILIAGLSFVGFLVGRWLGPKRGIAVTGLAGGMVSSTATTLSLSRRSREKLPEGTTATLAAGILFAWSVMFLRVVVMCIVVNAALARELAIPMTIMALIAAAAAIVNYRAGARLPAGGAAIQLRNPFSLSFAIKFALLLGLVALLVNRADAWMDRSGVYAVAALAGLTDVDAITLSMARDQNDTGVAVTAIVIAVLANTLVKAGLAGWIGRGTLARRVLPATVVLVVGAAAWILFR